MSDFKRFNKYMVFKRKDLWVLSQEQRTQLGEISRAVRQYRAGRGKGDMECVVVEHDWPMYEATWAAIEAYVNSLSPDPQEAAIKDTIAKIELGDTLTKVVSSSLTTDPTDPELGHGADTAPVPQNKKYLVLSEAERKKGFIRPYRDAYMHSACGAVTTMGRALSETYAREPKFYGSTYCCNCAMHRPVSEFHWYEMDGTVGPVVGT